MNDGISPKVNQSSIAVKHYWLYVLRLQNNKFYLGITSRKNPNVRINEHMNGFYSAQWVKRYKPIEFIEILELGNVTTAEAERLELKQTVQYMKKYGYQNVRGGKLNYSGKYIKVGNWFLKDEDFKTLIAVLLMMVSVAALLLKVY